MGHQDDWRADSSVEEQFEATVKRLRAELIPGIKRRYGVPDEDAEDIFQEGAISAFSRLGEASRRYGELFDLELYIRTMVDYSARNHTRKKKRNHISYEQISEDWIVDHSYTDLADQLTQRDKRNRQRFWRIFNEVLPSEQHRRVLRLVVEGGDSKKIAAELGISHDNARRLKSEAIERLSKSKKFCQVCRDLGLKYLPPEWLAGELVEQVFIRLRMRAEAQSSEVNNSAEVMTVQESTVRSFWMIVDSCLDDDTDQLLIRLVLGDNCLAIEQAAKVLCLDAATAKRRYSQAFKRLRCSEKLYEFSKRNELIPIQEVE